MNGIVIYKSKYGATARYAQWVSAELKLPYFEIDEIDDGDLDEYDHVILGTSVYMGRMLIKKWLKNNLKELGNKKIYLFVVCGTPLEQKDKLNSYVTASVPEEIRNKCDIFFLPGKLKKGELSWLDLFALKMGARVAKSAEVKKAMLTDYNKVKKENLAELIIAVNSASVRSEKIIKEKIRVAS